MDRRWSKPSATPHRWRTSLVIVTIFISVIAAAVFTYVVNDARESGTARILASYYPYYIYVGSISNESFRVGWMGSDVTGFIKWGETPATWDTYVGTDVRASGSTEFVPSASGAHIAQTDEGSGVKMEEATTYWFKIISNGIEYGDSASTDTVYGFSNCTDLSAASPGRPWGITTAPDTGAPEIHNITGLVEAGGISPVPANGIMIIVRLNDGSGDSLPILDVTRTIDEDIGAYDIDVGVARKVEDGTTYPISEGAAIKMFFLANAYIWPSQFRADYPDWIYDMNQWVAFPSPQTIDLHALWYEPIPEMPGKSALAVLAVLSLVVFFSRKRKRREEV